MTCVSLAGSLLLSGGCVTDEFRNDIRIRNLLTSLRGQRRGCDQSALPRIRERVVEEDMLRICCGDVVAGAIPLGA